MPKGAGAALRRERREERDAEREWQIDEKKEKEREQKGLICGLRP